MRLAQILAISLLLAGCTGERLQRPAKSADTRMQTVQRFVEAFNASDTARMLTMVTPDIEWLSVDGRSVHIESVGRGELESDLKDYFRGCPTCRARIEQVFAGPERVVTLELAYWRANGELREQSAVAVYEFSGERIRRVHYFPAEGRSGGNASGCTRRPC